MIKKALSLGLEPYPLTGYHVEHFPLIEIVPLPHTCQDEQLQKSSHLLFTSKTALDLFPFSNKPVIAVGKGTAKKALEKGFKVIKVAADETQEGICAVLDQLENISLFWPRSDKARSVISNFCKQRGIILFEHPIYTVRGKQVQLPDLATYDALFFTSPSTVEAFFASKPKNYDHIDLIPIGPITKNALNDHVN